jgi:hypothetical protein
VASIGSQCLSKAIGPQICHPEPYGEGFSAALS